MNISPIVSSTTDPNILHGDIGTDQLNSGTATSSSGDSANRHRHPASLTRLALISAFILPFTLFPYMLARRQLSSIRRQVAEAQTSIKILEQELDVSWREVMSRKYEIQKLRGTIREMMQETEQERALCKEKEERRSEFESEVKSDLHKLIKEIQNSRTHAATLRGLGTSLADVAAFMHEVELEMGMMSFQGGDQRGIERLRLLALKMEQIEAQPGPKDLAVTEDDEVGPY